jgi:hypothetical protein
VVLEYPVPVQYLFVEARRMETSIFWTPESASDALPHRPDGEHPAFQRAALYEPASAGKATEEIGAVVSAAKVVNDQL